MVFENGVKNIQTTAYNGARTVVWKFLLIKYTALVLFMIRNNSLQKSTVIDFNCEKY